MEPSNPVWNTVCQNSSTPTTQRLSSAAHSKIHLIADIEQHSTSEPQQYTATYDTLPATKLNNFTCIYNGEKSISGPVGRRLAEMRRHTAKGRGRPARLGQAAGETMTRHSLYISTYRDGQKPNWKTNRPQPRYLVTLSTRQIKI